MQDITDITNFAMWVRYCDVDSGREKTEETHGGWTYFVKGIGRGILLQLGLNPDVPDERVIDIILQLV